MNKYKGKEKLMEIIFLIAACISIISVVLICIFLFMNGIPAMKKIGFGDFIFGQRWRPGNNIFGIWPMILGSIYVTAGAIIIGVPIGVLSAIYLAKFCPKGIYKIIKPGVELLAESHRLYMDFSDWSYLYRLSAIPLKETETVF